MRKSKEVPETFAAQEWESAIEHCPIRDLLAHLGDKWSMLVLVALARDPQHTLRFSQIMNRVTGISQRMLTATLRYLERDGILTRRIYPQVPPRVEYTLSDRGGRLLVPVQAIVTLVQQEWPQISKARADYDKKQAKIETHGSK